MIAELANRENALVYRVPRKSKFSTILYKPYDKSEIRDKIRIHYGINKFNKCWKELCKHCLKKVKYRDFEAWAINPSMVSKCAVLPYWLYDEFESYINPYLTANAINKFKNKLDDLKHGY